MAPAGLPHAIQSAQGGCKVSGTAFGSEEPSGQMVGEGEQLYTDDLNHIPGNLRPSPLCIFPFQG